VQAAAVVADGFLSWLARQASLPKPFQVSLDNARRMAWPATIPR
jgi:hypothetical protein